MYCKATWEFHFTPFRMTASAGEVQTKGKRCALLGDQVSQSGETQLFLYLVLPKDLSQHIGEICTELFIVALPTKAIQPA